MGPLPKSLGGAYYVFVAVEDYSRYSYVECIEYKHALILVGCVA